MKFKENKKYVQTTIFDIKRFFEISVFEITRVIVVVVLLFYVGTTVNIQGHVGTVS